MTILHLQFTNDVCQKDFQQDTDGVRNTQIKYLRPHAQLKVIRRNYTRFQMDAMKDARRVVNTSFVNGNSK